MQMQNNAKLFPKGVQSTHTSNKNTCKFLSTYRCFIFGITWFLHFCVSSNYKKAAHSYLHLDYSFQNISHSDLLLTPSPRTHTAFVFSLGFFFFLIDLWELFALDTKNLSVFCYIYFLPIYGFSLFMKSLVNSSCQFLYKFGQYYLAALIK